MRLDELVRKSWKTLGWFSIDGSTCGFGDAAALGEDFQLSGQKPAPSSIRVEDYTSSGLALLCLNTMGDQEVPVEVARDDNKDVFAARLCLTNDVDRLEGEWLAAGKLEIKTGKCVALDPFCPPTPIYRWPFDVVPGVYSAQVFRPKGGWDIIAIRIGLGAAAKSARKSG